MCFSFGAVQSLSQPILEYFHHPKEKVTINNNSSFLCMLPTNKMGINKDIWRTYN